MTDEMSNVEYTGAELAVIGMSGRFPGAPDLASYWRVLCAGIEQITFFTDDELRESGVAPQVLRNPNYIKSRGIIDEVEYFDAAFFGYNPREALLMDPQQRLFLQAAWEALENAGYNPHATDALIGVYAGCSPSTWTAFLNAHRDKLGDVDGGALAIGNDLPFLTTRVSYKLNLRGPSYPVQTACSTSLVAVHLACQGLLNAECDLAIAGGVCIRVPQKNGYFYQPDGIFSADGHCRSYDARTRGTVFSHGLGAIILKRLDDALADRDHIYAIIKGSAINNDGSLRASFTAPGINGQTAVVADALANADVAPDTISYVEGHGSGTLLGDSIEVQALTRAFERGTSRKQFCALSAVKATIGHLDAAAGIAGLIKTVLSLHHGQIPPTAEFQTENPDIHFERTPFFVNRTLRPWQSSGTYPRRAGVSAFGFGGTNAHVVLEEAPARTPSGPGRPWQLLLMSADTEGGAGRAVTNLGARLAAHPDTNLADAAYTLALGRRAFRYRRALVARDTADAAAALNEPATGRLLTGEAAVSGRPVVFLFPGQGTQHANMGHELYQTESVFRTAVDECAAHLRAPLGCDVRELLYPSADARDSAAARLRETALTQVALFVIEYALGRQWQHWGVQPQACIGHSLGEYVAACFAGVFKLADALQLVALRGRLMQSMPPGVMSVVPRPAAEVQARLPDELALAAVNAPELCVVSGPADAIAAFEASWQREGVECRRLHTSHAFHSALMQPVVEPLVAAVAKLERQAPRIPYVSNLTGQMITAEQACDPHYYGRHLREAVRFADGVATLAAQSDAIFLEVGPGHTLGTLARAQLGPARGRAIIASLPGPNESTGDLPTLLGAAGRLWTAGATLNWTRFYEGQERNRVPLPTYPWEKTRYWLDGPMQMPKLLQKLRMRSDLRTENLDDWLYTPTWRRSALPAALNGHATEPANWLLLGPDSTWGEALAQRLRDAGQRVALVHPGPAYRNSAEHTWELDPADSGDYKRLFGDLRAAGLSPSRIVQFAVESGPPELDAAQLAREPASQRFLALARALSAVSTALPSELLVVTSHLFEVTGAEDLHPSRAALLGFCRVLPQEYPGLRCRVIDLPAEACADPRSAAATLVPELLYGGTDPAVAYRGPYRWVESFEPLRLTVPAGPPARLRQRGVYLITGGLGNIGLDLALHLARTVQARVVLTGRSPLPPRAEWEACLAAHAGDPRIRRLQALLEIERAGGEVLTLSADAGDPAQMADVLQATLQRFGALHGVFHAAGVLTGTSFKPLAELDPAILQQQYRPKVDGVHVLDELLRDRALDFCMLVSSLSAFLGGVNYGAYAGANIYLDSLARRRTRAGRGRWLTANWDVWLRDEDVARAERDGTPPRNYLSATEGLEIVRRLLAVDYGLQAIISTGDLTTRYEQWVSGRNRQPEQEKSSEAAAALAQPRPNLSTPFVAPTNPTEKKLAEIWQQLLGIDAVGIHDNFLELGGHSLMATQVLTRVREACGVQLPMRQLFESPTIAGLAETITHLAAETAAPPASGAEADREEITL